MGISDEDYADAIKKQHQAQRQKIEDLLEVVKAGSYTTTVDTTITQPYGQFKALTEKDLRHDGMKAPLSALVDMWTVRWGGEWVGETEFQEDDFWRIALVRLTGANKLEKHNLANQYTSVYRIIE
jgi:hypothetical protein